MKRSVFSILVGACLAICSLSVYASTTVELDGKYVSASAQSLDIVFVVPDLHVGPDVANAFRPAADVATESAHKPLDARTALGLAAKNRMLAFVDERGAGRSTSPKRWLS